MEKASDKTIYKIMFETTPAVISPETKDPHLFYISSFCIV